MHLDSIQIMHIKFHCNFVEVMYFPTAHPTSQSTNQLYDQSYIPSSKNFFDVICNDKYINVLCWVFPSHFLNEGHGALVNRNKKGGLINLRFKMENWGNRGEKTQFGGGDVEGSGKPLFLMTFRNHICTRLLKVCM